MVETLKMYALYSLEPLLFDLDRLPLELRDLVHRHKTHKTIKKMQDVFGELLCATYFIKSFFDKRRISDHYSISQKNLRYYSNVPGPNCHLRICMWYKHSDWYVLHREHLPQKKKN